MKLQPISLRRSELYTEKWVQEQIAEDPSILGLGDLELKDKERIQIGAGRLDLLLQNPETLKRYEVELQLGATDETHIIRTIEYWDIERRRYPQYEHAAVIVAEDITSRFLNIIQLFNGHIPLIALKMTAYKVGDQCALTFVKVLDELAFGLVDEDEVTADPVDRDFWEKRGSKKSLQITDALLKIVNEVEPKATLNYNKHYIGLKVGGFVMNFVSFAPRKAHVILRCKLAQTQEVDEELGESGLEVMSYDSAFKHYRLPIYEEPDSASAKVIKDLVQRSRTAYGKTD